MKKKTTISLAIIIGSIGVFACTVWAIPRALSLYYQEQGGRLLNLAFSIAGNSQSSPFACNLPPVDDPTVRSRLTLALQVLKRAIHYNPGASQAYLLLGRTECLLGEPKSAVETYLTYTRLRPENPLGHVELGFAYLAECQSEDPISTSLATGWVLCSQNPLQKEIITEWEKGGVSQKDLIENGHTAIFQNKYAVSTRFYQAAGTFGKPLPFSEFFLWNLAAVQSGQSLPDAPSSRPIATIPITETTEIDPTRMYWLLKTPEHSIDNGMQLKEIPSGNQNQGVMWWQGTAVSIIDIPCDSNYQIMVRSMNFNPKEQLNGQLELLKDNLPITRFTITKDWGEFQTMTYLTKGLHLLALSYVQDVGDAIIDRIRLNQMGSCW
jgi:hypothetical protein